MSNKDIEFSLGVEYDLKDMPTDQKLTYCHYNTYRMHPLKSAGIYTSIALHL